MEFIMLIDIYGDALKPLKHFTYYIWILMYARRPLRCIMTSHITVFGSDAWENWLCRQWKTKKSVN